MAMNFRIAFFFFVVVLACTISPALANCKCPKKGSGFTKKFKSAHTVVKAFLLQQWSSCHLCTGATNRKNAIRVYAFHLTARYKKPNPGKTFYAQAFENKALCGVKLVTGQTYMLNLANPAKISSASHWTKGWYVLDACQSHYNWKALSSSQLKFLASRIR